MYRNIPNHGPLFVIHEFHTDLLNVAARTSATEDFSHTGVPGGMLFDVHCTKTRYKGRGRGYRRWGLVVCFSFLWIVGLVLAFLGGN